MEQKKKKLSITTIRIIVYIAVTFIITYAVEIGGIWPLLAKGDTESVSTAYYLMAFAMLLPMTGMFITRVFTKEGLTDMYFVPKNFKKTWKYYVLAWFCPSILVIVGMIVFFLIFPGQYDGNMGYMAASLGDAAKDFTPSELQGVAVMNIVLAFVIGPILNFVNCVGEEWGWRGYLLPKMLEKMKVLPTILLTGVIWGLWHAPLTCIGHNYGVGYPGFPFVGIFTMCVFCIVIGCFLSYVTIRTKSCIPAALAHAAINGIASAGLLFTKSGGFTFLGPAPTGYIGMIGFIVAAVILVRILIKEEKNKAE